MTGAEVWSVVEILDGRPHGTAAKMASEASRLGRLLGATACCVAVDDLDDMDGTLLHLGEHGAAKVYVSTSGSDGGPRAAETVTDALAALVAEHRPRAVLFAATRAGSERAARLAARLRAGLVAGCVDYELQGETLLARRPVNGGKAHATLRWSDGSQPAIATMDIGSLEALAEGGSSPPEVVHASAATAGAPVVTLLSRWRLSPRELDLTEAAFIIGIGRPVDTPESLERVQALADRLGASLGGSRIAHFQGIVPKSRQIGASGKWISPGVYVTLGISGASYHVMGIKGAKHIIAVNSDPEAPIFRLAEVGIVADLEDVVEALLAVVGEPSEGSVAVGAAAS